MLLCYPYVRAVVGVVANKNSINVININTGKSNSLATRLIMAEPSYQIKKRPNSFAKFIKFLPAGFAIRHGFRSNIFEPDNCGYKIHFKIIAKKLCSIALR
jgi:hypothetical protein